MSALGHITILLAFFTTIPPCKVHAENIENEVKNESVFRANTVFFPNQVILVAEFTPVYVVSLERDRLVYRLLEKEAVKKAFQYWESKSTKTRRSVDGVINNVEDSHSILNFNRSKRSVDEEGKFLYPSVLAVVEHHNKSPNPTRHDLKYIFEKIVYTLKYWNEVNLELRSVKNPGVRIHIAGLIIAQNKAVSPEFRYRSLGAYSPYWTLGPTLQWWQKTRREFFPSGGLGFNVVATMSYVVPGAFRAQGTSPRFTGCGEYDSEQTGKLTNLTGLIVYDQGKFSHIEQAVAEFSHIMGRQYTGVRASVNHDGFTSDDLTDIRNGLREASCWEKPLSGVPADKYVY